MASSRSNVQGSTLTGDPLCVVMYLSRRKKTALHNTLLQPRVRIGKSLFQPSSKCAASIVTDFASAHNRREYPVPLLSCKCQGPGRCSISAFSKIVGFVCSHLFRPTILRSLYEIGLLLAISGSGAYLRADEDPN